MNGWRLERRALSWSLTMALLVSFGCAGGADEGADVDAAVEEPQVAPEAVGDPEAEAATAAAATAEPAAEATADAPVCVAVPGRLALDATLAGRAGTYRLEMIETVGGADGRRAVGTLTLFDMPGALTMLAGSATPLGGATDIDVRDVGANPAGEVDATDPSAPGVLVLERTAASGRSILLRFGVAANRRDSSPFDGAFTVLDVRVIGDLGFAGAWRSAVQGPQTNGYFCAWSTDR